MTNIIVTNSSDHKIIRLTVTQWKHIAYRHPEISNKIEEFEKTINHPNYTITEEEGLRKYYRYLKKESVYLMIAVRILNGDGFIITAYLTKGQEK